MKKPIKQFTFRFYDNEKDKKLLEWLDQFNKNYNFSRNKLIKEILYQVSERKCPQIKKEDKILKLIYEINKIGNNINQIAKKVNFTKKLDRDVLEQLGEIKNKLDEVIKNVS